MSKQGRKKILKNQRTQKVDSDWITQRNLWIINMKKEIKIFSSDIFLKKQKISRKTMTNFMIVHLMSCLKFSLNKYYDKNF